MHRRLRSILAKLIVLGALAVAESGALAQGVTGSAMTGIVTDPDGAPIADATVQLVNPATGETYTATTSPSGQYFLDNVVPGGPYVLTVAAPGYEAKTRERVQLALSQRLKIDIPLKYFGEPVEIVSHADALDDNTRTGPASTLKEATITGLPLQGRNFTDLVATSTAAARFLNPSSRLTVES